MTKEEIVAALLDDMEMPYLQDWQARDIVDFVIKNYKPSLPSDLDEAAVQAHIRMEESGEEMSFLNTFKAGAEWLAGQGVSMPGKVGIYGVDVESITEELRKAGFTLGEEVILQIRKK